MTFSVPFYEMTVLVDMMMSLYYAGTYTEEWIFGIIFILQYYLN